MDPSDQIIHNFAALRIFFLVSAVGTVVAWLLLRRILRPFRRRPQAFGKAMDIVAAYEKAIERAGIPLPRLTEENGPPPFAEILETHRRRALRLTLSGKDLPFPRRKIRAAIHACLSQAPDRRIKERLLIGLLYLPCFQ